VVASQSVSFGSLRVPEALRSTGRSHLSLYAVAERSDASGQAVVGAMRPTRGWRPVLSHCEFEAEHGQPAWHYCSTGCYGRLSVADAGEPLQHKSTQQMALVGRRCAQNNPALDEQGASGWQETSLQSTPEARQGSAA